MERFLESVVAYTRGVYARPRLAAMMYLVALFGVMTTSSFGSRYSGPRIPGPDTEAGPGKDCLAPEDYILDDFRRAGLQVVESSYGPKELILAPGDPSTQLYFLRSGMVRVYKTYGDFKEATTALLKDGGIFGDLDLEESTRGQDAFAEALTRARVVKVRKTAVLWLLRRKPELALALFSVLSDHMRRSDEMVMSLLPREVSARLAALLLNLSGRFGEEDGRSGSTLIDVRLSHRELASMIASTREAVSKAVNELRRDGFIEVEDRRMVVLDHKALNQIASRADV